MVPESTLRGVARERDNRRLAAQQLVGPPATGVVQVVDRLLAVQAQDLRAARLAVRARTTGRTSVDVDRELERRTLVVTWLNRGTLHLVRSQDYWWLQQLTTPQLVTNNARRLAEEGVSPDQADRGVAVVEAAIAANGPMTRGQLREVVQSADVPVEGQGMIHILFLSALRGLTVRGPVIGTQQAFVLVRDWLGDPPKVLDVDGPDGDGTDGVVSYGVVSDLDTDGSDTDGSAPEVSERDAPDGDASDRDVSDRDSMLSRLARRYLAGHGPADERDLARWAGITIGDARRGLRGVGAGLVEGPGGLLDLAGRHTPYGRPRPKLLGAFDPLLHGWVDRTPVLGGNQTIVTTNGIFRPFALVDGRAVATWGMRQGRVALEPFGRIAAPVRKELDREARDVERFLSTAQ